MRHLLKTMPGQALRIKLARSRFWACCCGWPFGSVELQTIDERRRARSGGWCRRGLSGHPQHPHFVWLVRVGRWREIRMWVQRDVGRPNARLLNPNFLIDMTP